MFTAVKLFAVLTILTGVIYPLSVTLIGRTLFPHQAAGSLIETNAGAVGSELIGQNFSQDKYFWPRPSAINYQPIPSGGSNLGPTSQALSVSVKDRIKQLAVDKPPSDLLWTSGSGLDPHISVEAARFQIDRVAKARGLTDRDTLVELVAKNAEGRWLGLIGQERVNVLKLNVSMDEKLR